MGENTPWRTMEHLRKKLLECVIGLGLVFGACGEDSRSGALLWIRCYQVIAVIGTLTILISRWKEQSESKVVIGKKAVVAKISQNTGCLVTFVVWKMLKFWAVFGHDYGVILFFLDRSICPSMFPPGPSCTLLMGWFLDTSPLLTVPTSWPYSDNLYMPLPGGLLLSGQNKWYFFVCLLWGEWE